MKKTKATRGLWSWLLGGGWAGGGSGGWARRSLTARRQRWCRAEPTSQHSTVSLRKDDPNLDQSRAG